MQIYMEACQGKKGAETAGSILKKNVKVMKINILRAK